MLTVSNLSRSYGSFLAVDTVSFSIKPGEIVGLLGHNGAGKTTIMKMLSGYLEPDAGSVEVDGCNLASNPKRIQGMLGYLPENLPVYPEMTVGDYLDYAADLKGLQGDLKTAEIRRAVSATDIAAKITAPIATLSRGFKQRVGVAQAILGKPRFLILDEPTNGLDPTQTEHMRRLIRELAQHATVILSTHIMQEVEALCDRVLIVKGGRLVVDAALADLRQSRELDLVSDLDPAALRKALQAQPALTALHTVGQATGAWRSYRIELSAAHDLHDAAASITATITHAGGRVALLQPVVRNLETLFREVSERTEETRHAA
jgi:ABC-2 type transport system ATP-binding protein